MFYNTNWFYHNSQLLLWTLSRSEVGRSDGCPIGKINLFGFFLETGSELIWLSRWVGHSTNCMKEWCDQDARTGLFLWTRGEPNSIFKGWCWCPHEHLLAHPCTASRTSLKRVPRIPTGWCCTQRGIWSPFHGNWNSFWFLHCVSERVLWAAIFFVWSILFSRGAWVCFVRCEAPFPQFAYTQAATLRLQAWEKRAIAIIWQDFPPILKSLYSAVIFVQFGFSDSQIFWRRSFVSQKLSILFLSWDWSVGSREGVRRNCVHSIPKKDWTEVVIDENNAFLWVSLWLMAVSGTCSDPWGDLLRIL